MSNTELHLINVERITRLEAELREERQRNDAGYESIAMMSGKMRAMKDHLTSAAAVVEGLVGVARHHHNCWARNQDRPGRCSCGLDAAIASAAAWKGGQNAK